MMTNVPCQSGAAALLTLLASVSVVTAQDASPWLTQGHSSARLLAGSRSGAMMLGGIDLQLQNGWKTYWRTPGDSGVPPRFDFSASDNVEAVTVLWPAPAKFEDGAGGFSIGYKNHVLLPIRVVAKDPDKPVTLRADISYAVCEKLCVPVEAQLSLPFTGIASTQDKTLASALDTVPKPSSLGKNTPPAIRDVKRDGGKVFVDVTAPDASPLDLFVEGPTLEWSLPVPKFIKRDAGIQTFAFNLEGLPPDTKPEGAALKLTLVGRDAAYEYNVTLE